jgi:hypothetical protein
MKHKKRNCAISFGSSGRAMKYPQRKKEWVKSDDLSVKRTTNNLHTAEPLSSRYRIYTQEAHNL